MRISFPIMGSSYLAFKQLLKGIGHEAIVAPLPTAKTMSLGTMYSPEFACIPFKIMLGTYLEAIEKGAEVIVSSGGHGPCRAGYYGVIHQKIIQDLGYDIKFIIFDSFMKTRKEFMAKLNWLRKTGKSSWWQFFSVVSLVLAKIKALDEIEICSYHIRPYEINCGETSRVYRECLKLMDESLTKTAIKEVKEVCLEMLNNIPQDKRRNPLKIGIVGEIYVLIEPFANLDLQATLGELGVYTERSMYLYHWLKENTNSSRHEMQVIKAAQPYLRQMIGGHGLNSVGETVLFAERGFDGVIQLAPFSCIPEIVAKGILPQVSQDQGIPVMTIFLDEMMGKVGMQTRIEAFVDLLSQRRELKLV